jgi:23S rRNA (uracil1939-C5)-methyltransferase
VKPDRVPPAVLLARIEEIEVRVEKLVAGGEGLARFEGVPVFIPRSAPGDLVRARLVERRPSFGRAEITEILEPGPGRRHPPCPYFARCGGCDLQHLEEDLQRELRVAAVRETLERLGGVVWPGQVEVVAGKAWAYRLRAQLHTAVEGQDVEVGYYARRSHRLVAVDSCPILVPELEALLPHLAGDLDERAPRRLDVTTGDDGAVTASPAVETLPHGTVSRRIGDLTYAYDARCFFQAHVDLLPGLVERVVGSWDGRQAFDLYCGVGLFSLPLARLYESVLGVDGDRVAVRYARKNARGNGITNLEILAHAVESWIGKLPRGTARVVVDPPRTGLSPRVRGVLRRRRPRRLTYVSCHPATLARDLKELLRSYHLEGLTLLDLFPQTGHMEVVAQLMAK